jgi:hypothetical protein
METDMATLVSGDTPTQSSVAVSSTESATIFATSSAASLAAAGSLGVSVAIAGAGADATNVILGKDNAYISGSTVTSAGGVSVTTADTSDIQATIVTAAVGVGLGAVAGAGASIGASVAQNFVGYNGDGTQGSLQIMAYVQGSSISATKDLTLTATSNQTITATVVAGSVAVGAGFGLGLAASGAGVSTQNTIGATVKAYIDGDGATGIEANTVSVTASDTSTIAVNAESVAVAFSAGIVGAGSIAIGTALATNTIGNDVEASVSDASTKVKSRAGDLKIDAEETASITTTCAAASAAVAIGPGAAASGAGANSTNMIGNTVAAFVHAASGVEASGAVKVTANDTPTISATTVAATLAGGLVGVAVGALVADNTVGENISAYTDGAHVTADGGNIEVTATSNPSITASSVVAAVSASIGASGAGADSQVTIKGTTQAYVTGSTLSASGNAVNVHATTTSTATPTEVGTSLGQVAVAAITSEATTEGTTQAYIGGGTTSITATKLDIQAKDTSNADSTAVVVGVGEFTGAGAGSTSLVDRTTQAYIAPGAVINANGGSVAVGATSSATPNADVVGVSVGGVAITADNISDTIMSPTYAYVGEGASVTAGSVDVEANATNDAEATPTNVAVGLAAGSGTKTTVTVAPDVQAFFGPQAGAKTTTGNTTTINVGSTGTATIHATSSNTASIDFKNGTGAGLSISALNLEADINGSTQAYGAGKASITANKFDLKADTTKSSVTTKLFTLDFSGIGGSGSSINANMTHNVAAYVAGGANVRATGSFNVGATSVASADAEAHGGSGSIVANVVVMLPTARDTGNTQAYIGEGANVGAGSLQVAASANTRNATANLFALAISLGGSGAGANAQAEVGGSVEAFIGPQAGATPLGNTTTLNVPGTVQVMASSASDPTVNGTVGAGALFSGVGMVSNAKVDGTTRAYLAQNLNVQQAGNLSVTASDTSAASDTATIGSGGGATGRGTDTEANVTPTVNAYVGANVTANVNGAVDIEATSVDAEAHATAKSFGGGGVDIGIPEAKSTSKPSVSAYVGIGSSLTTAGGVTVKAGALSTPSQTLDDYIDGVNTANGTIAFPTHGLSDGDLVLYVPPTSPGSTPIGTAGGPLVANRQYGALAYDANDIRLGNDFNAQAANTGGFENTAFGIDAGRRVIKFAAPDQFLTGDAVKYDPLGQPQVGGLSTSQTYYVRVLDPQTIQLFANQADATAGSVDIPASPVGTSAVEGDNQTIDTTKALANGETFTNGEAVTYQAQAPAPFSSAGVDVDYQTNGSGNIVPYSTNPLQIFKNDSSKNNIFLGQDIDGDGIPEVTQPFQTGDEVIYHTDNPTLSLIGGLQNDTPYFVIRIDQWSIQLATTRARALHTDSHGNPDQFITLTPNKTTNASDPTQDATLVHQFLRVNPLGTGNANRLVDGETYFVKTMDSGKTFQLFPDATLSGSPLNLSTDQTGGIHHFHMAGIPVTSATGVQQLYIALTSRGTGTSPNPGETGETGDKLLGAGGISLRQVNPPPGNGVTSASAQGGSGGGLEFSFPSASADVEPNVQAYVNATAVNAGRDVLISTTSSPNVTADGNNAGGGAIHVGQGEGHVTVTNTVSASIGDNVTLTTPGSLSVDANFSATTNASAESYGGGLFADVNAISSSNLTNTMTVTVGKSDNITARTVSLFAHVHDIDAHASADSKAGGFIGAAVSDSNSDVTSTATAHLSGTIVPLTDTKVTGSQGVDVRAVQENIKASQSSTGFFIGIGPTIHTGDGDDTLMTHVNADPGVTVFAGPRRSDALADLVPIPGNPTLSHLALFSEATDQSNSADDVSNDRHIDWNSNVVILDGPSPTLVVDANGNIQTAINVSVNGPNHTGGNSTAGTSAVNANGDVNVDDITNKDPGDIQFTTNSTDGDTQITHSLATPTFTIRDTYDSVSITNNSAHRLIINNIFVQNTGGTPQVELDANTVNLLFHINHDVSPTLVTITQDNLHDSTPQDILFQGLVNNPIGKTIVLDTNGNILSASDRVTAETGTELGRFAIIRTNVLTITASAGMIGDDSRNHVYTNRVNVDLVQSVNSDTGATRPISLTASASGNDRLDLQGHIRDNSFDPTKNTWVVPINSITAGGNDDIQLQAAQQDSKVGTVGGVNVAINFNEDSHNPFFNFYTPDTGSPGGQDLGVYAQNSTPIASTYDFEGRDSSGNLNGLPGLEAGGNILVAAAHPLPADTLINVLGLIDVLGSGHVDVLTNGFITLTEYYTAMPIVQNVTVTNPGDLRAGTITSTNGDVTLYSPRSILDAVNHGVGTDANVTGINITMTAGLAGVTGGIGLPTDFLEINVNDEHGTGMMLGDLTAIDTAAAFTEGIFITDVPRGSGVAALLGPEATNDLEVGMVNTTGDVSLATASGSIVDARYARGAGSDTANVFGNTIDLYADGGSIGDPNGGNDLKIYSHRYAPGTIGARATGNIDLTQTTGNAQVVLIQSLGGNARFTVRKNGGLGEDLNLLASGIVLFLENAAETIVHGLINAVVGSVLLRVGDNVTTDPNAQILAGQNIDIYGDFRRVNELSSGIAETDPTHPGFGTIMHLAGVIAHGPTASGYLTRVFGSADASQTDPISNDQIYFDQTFLGGLNPLAPGGTSQPIPDSTTTLATYLGGKTNAYGSNTPTPAPFQVPVSFSSTGNTLMRLDTGNWVTDGLVAGQEIEVSGTANNNAIYTILHVTASTLMLAASPAVSNEGPVTATIAPFAGPGSGSDFFVVNQLQSMENINGPDTPSAGGDALTLDGQGGGNTYVVNSAGSQHGQNNYVINVLDTGAPDEGTSSLSVYGADSTQNGINPATGQEYPADDIFLTRRLSYIPGETAYRPALYQDTPAFVAVLQTTLPGAQGAPISPGSPYVQAGSFGVEQINYDGALSRLMVFGQGGNDYFASDDVTVATTFDGGAGDNTFQIGQLYGLQRDGSTALPPSLGSTLGGSLQPQNIFPQVPTALTPQDIFGTVATTRGWLSAGNSAPLVAEGGSGNNTFVVYSNQAPLRLEGHGGNNLFEIRAFALAQTDPVTGDIEWIDPVQMIAVPRLTSGFSTAAQTDVRTGQGNNQVEYNINAPVSIDGGNGFNKMVVLGTEFADHIVVTAQAIYGAGLAVSYSHIQVIEIDALEGDDTIDVLSTAPGVAVRVVGGAGNNTINVAGDVAGDVVSRDIAGTSGTINQNIISSDPNYDGVVTDGIDLSVARPTQGQVIIDQPRGFTAVTEGGNDDSYGVYLAQQPLPGTHVYVVVSAPVAPEEEIGNNGMLGVGDVIDGIGNEDTLLLSPTAGTGFTRQIVINGQTVTIPQRAMVLVFDHDHWNKQGQAGAGEQFVNVRAVNDAAPDADRVVIVSHTVLSDDPSFDHAIVQNVEVTIHDNTQPAILLTQLDPTRVGPAPYGFALDSQTTVLMGNSTTAVNDLYAIQLAAPPTTGSVTVDVMPQDSQVVLSSTDTRFVTVNAATADTPGFYQVTFAASNWTLPVLVTVQARNIATPEDPHDTPIIQSIDTTLTTDPGYLAAAAGANQRLDVSVVSDKTAGLFQVTGGGQLVATGGSPSAGPGPGISYTTRLTEAPKTSVTVAIITDGQADVTPGGRISLQQVGGLQASQLFKGNVTIAGTTITLASGSELSNFLDDGFAAGQLIRVSGTGSADDADYTIASVDPSGSFMTLQTAAPVASTFKNGVIISRLLQQGLYTGSIQYNAAAAPFLLFTGNVQISGNTVTSLTRGTSFINDNFAPGMQIQIGSLAGTFTVSAVTDTTLTLTAAPTAGTYTNIGISKLLDTLVRADGSSWLDSGFLEGQLFEISGTGNPALDGKMFKIDLVTGTSANKLDELVLTDHSPLSASPTSIGSGDVLPGSGTAIMTITQWAPVITFTGLDSATPNWYVPVTVPVVADPWFDVQPGHQSLKSFPKRLHLLSDIQGPLLVEGGPTAINNSLRPALLLPGEANGPFFGIATPPPEAQEINTLNIFDDGSVQNQTGALSATTVTGLGMPSGTLDFSSLLHGKPAPFGEPGVYPLGISYGTITVGTNGQIQTNAGLTSIQVLNILLGSGNDNFAVTSTMVPGPTHNDDGSFGPVAEHGGITAINGGGASLLQVPGPFDVGPGQIVRDDGMSWAASGFAVGQQVVVNLTGGTSGSYTVTGFGDLPGAAGSVLFLSAASGSPALTAMTGAAGMVSVTDYLQVTGIFNVPPTPDNRITRTDGLPWWSLGFAIGQQVSITGIPGTRTILGFDNATPTSGFGSTLIVSGPPLPVGNFTGTVAVTSRFQVGGTFTLSDPSAGVGDVTRIGDTWANAGFAVGNVVVIPGVSGNRTVTGFGNFGMDLLVSGGALTVGSVTGIVGVVRVGGNNITVTGGSATFTGNFTLDPSVLGDPAGTIGRLTRTDGSTWDSMTFAPGQQISISGGGLAGQFVVTGITNGGATLLVSGVTGIPGSISFAQHQAGVPLTVDIDSPLVVYGSTSQSGVWYSGNPTELSLHDFGPKPMPHQDNLAVQVSNPNTTGIFTLDPAAAGDPAGTVGRITRTDNTTWSAAGFVALQTLTLSGGPGGTFTVAGFANAGATLLVKGSGAPFTHQTGVSLTVTEPTVGLVQRNDGQSWVAAGFTVEGLIAAGTSVPVTFTRSPAGDTITRTDGGSWLAANFTPGETIVVFGTANNNGTYTIASAPGSVTDSVLTLTVANTVTPGSEAAATVSGNIGTVSNISPSMLTLIDLQPGFAALASGAHTIVQWNWLGNGAPDFVFPVANPFQYAGNNVINASQLYAGIPNGQLPPIGLTVYGGPGNDIILGSQAGDQIAGGSGNNTILGERGANDIYGADGFNVNLITRQLQIVTTNSSTYPDRDPLQAGNNLIYGNIPGDYTTTDVYGDYDNTIFGALGVITQDTTGPRDTTQSLPSLPQDLQTTLRNRKVVSAALQNAGNNIIYGSGGQNILIGSSGTDSIGGGNERDLIFGDNVSLDRTTHLGNFTNLRFEQLTGTLMYDPTTGQPLVNNAPQLDPRGSPRWGDYLITLIQHSAAPAAGTFGNDYIAGGGADDMIFGELGDDTIQGDGSIDYVSHLENPDGTINMASPGGRVGASRSSTGLLLVYPSFDGATDGQDYIEGGGGNDVIFGGQGQDDLIGGSSNMFSLTAPGLRPDGSDIIFGGSGTKLTQDDLDVGENSTTGQFADHASDADMILGDNGNIIRLVTPSSGAPNGDAFLTFVYDSTPDIGSDPNNPTALQSRGPVRVIPRAYLELDYTPGVASATDIGASDLVYGERGDDTILGEAGNDVLNGGGGDDNIIGGTGMDKIFGGTGEDAILGDDGLIYNSRNGFPEPLYGVSIQQQQTISLPGPWTGAVINITNELKDIVNLNIGGNGPSTYTNGYDDIIYGGLGDDFIHGGAGDDAISGGDALPQFYNDTRPEDADLASSGSAVPFLYNRDLSIDYWVDPFTGQKDLFYNANNPLPKIVAPNGDDFILNFTSFDVLGNPVQDGKDWIYGDQGNDILFGGTGHNRLFGGTGDDYLQADNNLNTDGGLNDTSDDATNPQLTAGAADFVYGGDGLDVMIANSGSDRMFDWGGEFNSYLVPFARFGEPTIYRSPNPHIMAFLSALSAAGGADQNLIDPSLVPGDVEIGMFDQSSPLWNANHGGPRDPQPGNFPKGTYDTPGGPENDTLDAPLQTAAGSTPVSPEPPQGGGHSGGNTPAIAIQKDVNAADPLHPTAAENANDPTSPRLLLTGNPVVWTYLVTNTGNVPLAINTITDDNGTPTVPGDDFSPFSVLQTGTTFNIGDTNKNGLLDPGETWLYTSQGAVSPSPVVQAGFYGNTATVSATTSTGQTLNASDPAYYFGTDTILNVQKAVNAVNPLSPTTAEDANDPNNPLQLAVGTNVVWTYLLTNPGLVPLTISSLTDDAGTPTLPNDDFRPAPVLQSGTAYNIGDTNKNGVLDPGEKWLYTSAGVRSYQVQPGAYGNTLTVMATGTTNGKAVTAKDPAYIFGTTGALTIHKAINAVDPLHPTATEDANDPNNPRLLAIGTNVVWTYLVTNSGTVSMTIRTLTDDNGTPSNTADDFNPKYVSGDTNNNGKLDPGETWLYTSAGVKSFTVTAGAYGNTAAVTATASGNQTFTASDPAYLFGTDTILKVQKDINAVDPLHPTTAEDANDPANPRMLLVGTPVVWTYLLTNLGIVPLTVNSLTDNAGTPTVTTDDFIPAPVLVTFNSHQYNIGDTNHNGLLDPGEAWLYASTGTVTVGGVQYPITATFVAGGSVPAYTVQQGLYGNIATVTATGSTGKTVTASDSNWHFGTTPSIFVRKLVNGLYSPTAPGVTLPNGTPVVWTYEVTDQGDAPVKVTSIRDDAGTPNNPADDFTPVAVLQPGTNFNIGDTNNNGLLDPGEVWKYSSAGVSTGSPTSWTQVAQAVFTNTDTSGAGATGGFVVDPVQTPNSFQDNIFTGGGSKDVNGISQWQWKLQQPQDKDDLENAFAATVASTDTGHTLAFAGVDRYSASGSSTVGFWFFQNPISVNANGTFSGVHTEGDLLLVVNFAVSITNPPVAAYVWEGTDATGTIVPFTPPAGSTFASVPAGPVPVPWTFIDKSGHTLPQTGEFLEVGADLNALFPAGVPHYVSFLTETRSSNSVNSTLSDFALGAINTIGTIYKVHPGPYANTVTVAGVDLGTNLRATGTSTSYHTGQGAYVQVQKAVNAANPLSPTSYEDANVDPGYVMPVGTTVTWTYLVSNTGNGPASGLTLTDDAGMPGVPGDGFAPAPVLVTFNNQQYNAGDTNHNGLLDPGETWQYTSASVRPYSAQAGQFTGTVTATATDTQHGWSLTATDVANHFGAMISVTAQDVVNARTPSQPTTAEDANTAPGVLLPVGSGVTWTYLFTNTGNIALNVISLLDDAGTPSNTNDDIRPRYLSGDTNNNGLLDPGETWLYNATGTATTGQYTSTAHFSATVVGTNPALTATASDPANYFGVAARVKVVDAVNAANPMSPTTAEDANTAPGVIVAAGSHVTWTYLLTNPGNAPLHIVSVVDNAGTPNTTSDDFGAQYVSGDSNSNGLLDPGETWLYRATGTAATGQYTSTATVTATDSLLGQTVTATDPANLFGAVVSVQVKKAVNALKPLSPTGIEDSNAAPGKDLMLGTGVTWTYLLTNTGNIAVSVTSLVDNNGTTTVTSDDFKPAYVSGDSNNNGLLDPGETWLYTSTGAMYVSSGQAIPAPTVTATGQYVNTATLSVAVPGTTVTGTSSDPAYDYGIRNGEGLPASFWQTNANSHSAVAWPRFPSQTGALVYSPSQLLTSVFTIPSSYGLGSTTLLQGLGLTGNGASGLMSAAVAALLNATHPRIAYPLTASQVISQVNSALASGNTNTIKSLTSTLTGYNNLGGTSLDQNGNTTGPQLAAFAPTALSSSVPALTLAELAPIVVEAEGLWVAAGASPAALAADVEIADLSNGSAGQAPVIGYTNGTVLIDAHAGGFGWFIDPTPADNNEFRFTGSATDLWATPGSPAYGRMDLLTVVTHELGHVLGLPDLPGPESTHDIMAQVLSLGERRLPGPSGSSAVDAAAPAETLSSVGGQLAPPSPIFDQALHTNVVPDARQVQAPIAVLQVPASGGPPADGFVAQAGDVALASYLQGIAPAAGPLATNGSVVSTTWRNATNDGVLLGGQGDEVLIGKAGSDLLVGGFDHDPLLPAGGNGLADATVQADLDLFFASLGDATRENDAGLLNAV